MIEYVHIENFKAFKEETIVLGNHTMLIGTHKSGKTTVLEALDAFFNHSLPYSSVRNKRKPVSIRCRIGDAYFKKVFSPPHFLIDYGKCEGDFSKLTEWDYVYIPRSPLPLEHFHYTLQRVHYKALLLENANLFAEESACPLRFVDARVERDVEVDDGLSPKDRKALLATWLTRLKGRVILGIDVVENHIRPEDMESLHASFVQVLLVSRQKNFINAFPYTIYPLYRREMDKELTTLTEPLRPSQRKPFILVEGKYDVPWFENALIHLGKFKSYRVVPCGGHGNIKTVEAQLRKAGFRTLSVTDGDAYGGDYALSRDVIELYADIEFLNARFETDFTSPPPKKHALFSRLNVEEETFKRVISSYPAHHLHASHVFVRELASILKDYENRADSAL